MKKQRIPLKRHKNSNAIVESKLDTALKSSFLGILFTAGVSLALLFASTAAALMTDDPTAFASPIGYVSAFLSAFIGGFICSKIDKRAPYLVSALTGCAFVLLSMLFSFAIPHTHASGMPLSLRLSLHGLTFLLFPIGTLVGVKASKPQRKIKKRR